MKKLIVCLLVVVMLMSTVSAASTAQINTADAMNELGLFLGTDLGYELEKQLTRAQGVTMLVRMIGKESTAKDGRFGDPFTDVDAWAKGYVGYAWKNKITNGISATEFGPNMTMTDYMFLTLTLRALGYSDSAQVADFEWREPYALAKKIGLIETTRADNYFTRAEAVAIFWNALNAKLKNSSKTLADTLIEQGVFTAKEFADAAKVQKDGREENVGVPQQPSGSGNGNQSGSGNQGGATTDPSELTYEEYLEMTPEEQQAYYLSYEKPEDFFAWLNKAKEEYEANQNDIEIGGDGSIDIGDIINGNG